MKDPFFAGFLNLLPGLGYLYLGVRKVFASLILAGTLLFWVDAFTDPNADALAEIPMTVWSVFGIILTTVAFVADGYLEGKRLQKAFIKKKKGASGKK
ncbi:MAG TPA: hypothetical protein VK963_00425 [Candidatus Saccharimonadales bacterium]|nr:hypothetical protein [Candidatus Saccharimonadales bacterium]